MKCPKCGAKLNIGKLLGSRKSRAKSAAARANGKKGGRPRKVSADSSNVAGEPRSPNAPK